MNYNPGKNETKKEKRAKDLHKFRSTFNNLKNLLTVDEMSKITGIHASNLSAYGNGTKAPSEDTINKFYTRLKTHIAKLSKKGKNTKDTEHADQVEEESMTYGRRTKRVEDAFNDLVKLLSDNYDRMLSDNEHRSKAFDKIADNNTKMVDTTNKMADSNNKMADSNNKMADSTNQLATVTAQLTASNLQLSTINGKLYEKLFPNSSEPTI